VIEAKRFKHTTVAAYLMKQLEDKYPKNAHQHQQQLALPQQN